MQAYARVSICRPTYEHPYERRATCAYPYERKPTYEHPHEYGPTCVYPYECKPMCACPYESKPMYENPYESRPKCANQYKCRPACEHPDWQESCSVFLVPKLAWPQLNKFAGTPFYFYGLRVMAQVGSLHKWPQDSRQLLQKNSGCPSFCPKDDSLHNWQQDNTRNNWRESGYDSHSNIAASEQTSHHASIMHVKAPASRPRIKHIL